MNFLRTVWQSRFSSCAVEAKLADLRQEVGRQSVEISCLRTENRALLNSILGIAGMKPLPPLPISATASFTTPPAAAGHSESSPRYRAADQPLSTPTATSSPTDVASAPPPRQSETRNGSSHVTSTSSPRQIHIPPHRRRSWHQINRMLELQSNRKEVNNE